jgi:hypothetical protein
MADKIIGPLSGWPETEILKTDDGLPAYRVTPRVLTPRRALMAEGWGDVAGIVLVVGFTGALVVARHHPDWPTLLVIGTVLCAWAMTEARKLITRLFRKRQEVVMTPTRIGVRRGGEWHWHTREIEHRVTLLPHDKALQEQRANDRERASAGIDRKVPRLQYVYADSCHVALELAGHRFDLMEVFGPLEASAIVARLQYLDRVLDAQIHRGRGVPNRPGDDWPDAPGAVL